MIPSIARARKSLGCIEVSKSERTFDARVQCAILDEYGLSFRGDEHFVETTLVKPRAQGLCSLDFAVDQADFPGSRRQWTELIKQVVVIGVAGKTVQIDHFGPFVPFAPVKADRGAAFEQLASRRAGRLIAHQGNGTPRIVNMLLEMSED